MEVSEMNALVESLIAMSGDQNVIVVRKPFVEFTGSLEAGMMLNQLLYWTPRGGLSHDWVAKSDEDFSKELCMTKYALRKARTLLETKGLLETAVRKFAGTPTVHYRMNLDAFCEAWVAWLPTRATEESQSQLQTSQPDFAKTQNGLCENAKSYTETTAKTTEEIPAQAQVETSVISAADPSESDNEPIRSNAHHHTDEDHKAFIAELENASPPKRIKHTPEEIKASTARASARGWANMNYISPLALERALKRYGDEAPALRELHRQIEIEFGLVPDWNNKRQVKSWVSGLKEVWVASRENQGVVVAAGKYLREQGLPIATPRSLTKMALSIAAERVTAHTAPSARAVREYV